MNVCEDILWMFEMDCFNFLCDLILFQFFSSYLFLSVQHLSPFLLQKIPDAPKPELQTAHFDIHYYLQQLWKCYKKLYQRILHKHWADNHVFMLLLIKQTTRPDFTWKTIWENRHNTRKHFKIWHFWSQHHQLSEETHSNASVSTQCLLHDFIKSNLDLNMFTSGKKCSNNRV